MDNGALVNIILTLVMHKLGRNDDELVDVDVVVINFMRRSCKVLPK